MAFLNQDFAPSFSGILSIITYWFTESGASDKRIFSSLGQCLNLYAFVSEKWISQAMFQKMQDEVLIEVVEIQVAPA